MNAESTSDSLLAMRALSLDANGPAFHTDWPEPRPAQGETVVRVLYAGICETDLQLIQGYKGFRGVLGHEFVGVAESGPFEGTRVVGEINCACGHCATCAAGIPVIVRTARYSEFSAMTARSRTMFRCRSATCTGLRTRLQPKPRCSPNRWPPRSRFLRNFA